MMLSEVIEGLIRKLEQHGDLPTTFTLAGQMYSPSMVIKGFADSKAHKPQWLLITGAYEDAWPLPEFPLHLDYNERIMDA
jgi:hypothetical protein